MTPAAALYFPVNMNNIPLTPALLRGALELEQTARGLLPHRLPARARAQCSDPQLAMAEAQPSGVRLVFQNRAKRIERDVQTVEPQPKRRRRLDHLFDAPVAHASGFQMRAPYIPTDDDAHRSSKHPRGP